MCQYSDFLSLFSLFFSFLICQELRSYGQFVHVFIIKSMSCQIKPGLIIHFNLVTLYILLPGFRIPASRKNLDPDPTLETTTKILIRIQVFWNSLITFVLWYKSQYNWDISNAGKPQKSPFFSGRTTKRGRVKGRTTKNK